jgi:hypothetical protein
MTVFKGEIRLQVPPDKRHLRQEVIHYLLNEVVDKFETLDNDGVKLDPPTKDGLIFGLSAIDPRPNVIKRYGLTQAGVSVTQAKDEAGK